MDSDSLCLLEQKCQETETLYRLIMSTRIITLTTDFGLKDTYVAEIKGVILGLYADAIVVDLTHEIEKFNVRVGAFMLASAVPFFPSGTIHLAVVDPGVGSRRRSIIIQTKKGFFVGPDNGLMMMAARNQGIISIREIVNSRLMSNQVSNTFHGRDIFAPAAAYLAKGVPQEEFGPEIHDPIELCFAKVVRRKEVLIGEVLHIDNFGNIITNLSKGEITKTGIKDEVKIELPSGMFKLKLCKAYADAGNHKPLALIGSHGYLEVALNHGRAVDRFETKAGDKFKLWLA
jgi:S-adenosylmethionine hydrolase